MRRPIGWILRFHLGEFWNGSQRCRSTKSCDSSLSAFLPPPFSSLRDLITLVVVLLVAVAGVTVCASVTQVRTRLARKTLSLNVISKLEPAKRTAVNPLPR